MRPPATVPVSLRIVIRDGYRYVVPYVSVQEHMVGERINFTPNATVLEHLEETNGRMFTPGYLPYALYPSLAPQPPVLKHLARHFPAPPPRDEIPRVLVNGDPCPVDKPVEIDDLIAHAMHHHEPPVLATLPQILYISDNYIVVNKPAGVPAHPSGPYRINTLTQMLSELSATFPSFKNFSPLTFPAASEPKPTATKPLRSLEYSESSKSTPISTASLPENSGDANKPLLTGPMIPLDGMYGVYTEFHFSGHRAAQLKQAEGYNRVKARLDLTENYLSDPHNNKIRLRDRALARRQGVPYVDHITGETDELLDKASVGDDFETLLTQYGHISPLRSLRDLSPPFTLPTTLQPGNELKTFVPAYYHKLFPKLLLVHRLDKVTSGVFLIARSQSAVSRAAKNFSVRAEKGFSHSDDPFTFARRCLGQIEDVPTTSQAEFALGMEDDFIPAANLSQRNFSPSAKHLLNGVKPARKTYLARVVGEFPTSASDAGSEKMPRLILPLDSTQRAQLGLENEETGELNSLQGLSPVDGEWFLVANTLGAFPLLRGDSPLAMQVMPIEPAPKTKHSVAASEIISRWNAELESRLSAAGITREAIISEAKAEESHSEEKPIEHNTERDEEKNDEKDDQKDDDSLNLVPSQLLTLLHGSMRAVCTSEAVERSQVAVSLFRRVSFDGTTSLVECQPLTGRTHQLRAHLWWLGHPIANDSDYGGFSLDYAPYVDENVGLEQQAARDASTRAVEALPDHSTESARAAKLVLEELASPTPLGDIRARFEKFREKSGWLARPLIVSDPTTLTASSEPDFLVKSEVEASLVEDLYKPDPYCFVCGKDRLLPDLSFTGQKVSSHHHEHTCEDTSRMNYIELRKALYQSRAHGVWLHAARLDLTISGTVGGTAYEKRKKQVRRLVRKYEAKLAELEAAEKEDREPNLTPEMKQFELDEETLDFINNTEDERVCVETPPPYWAAKDFRSNAMLNARLAPARLFPQLEETDNWKKPTPRKTSADWKAERSQKRAQNNRMVKKKKRDRDDFTTQKYSDAETDMEMNVNMDMDVDYDAETDAAAFALLMGGMDSNVNANTAGDITTAVGTNDADRVALAKLKSATVLLSKEAASVPLTPAMKRLKERTAKELREKLMQARCENTVMENVHEEDESTIPSEYRNNQ